MRYRWASRGARQSTIDLWPKKPVKVRGDWRANADSPKRYFSYETITEDVAKSLGISIPECGEVIRI